MTATTAIIDYGSGNLHSAAKAFERAAREAELDAQIVVTSDATTVKTADRIVLPGVGAFADCRAGLDAVPGMIEALEQRVLQEAAPFLGICVGMQLMADTGHEHGEHAGLGWMSGHVREITPDDPSLKVPHMGWNTLAAANTDPNTRDAATHAITHPVFAGLPLGPDGWHAYFVHSFHMLPTNPAHTLANTTYGGAITAAIGHDNMVGTQFHPEKSQQLGLSLITNFLRWTP